MTAKHNWNRFITMVGSTILHYKILEKLGEGGMGVVYLAEDTKLERRVAIKFLPRNISGNSEERERFKIEAKAAAALNHPNIATIHAIEESNDQIFIAMEYIEGVELKDKIKSGPLSLDETKKIATQIAEGLESAHKKGIVHRDIKTSNIMITETGVVKIMDFGLAKVGEDTQITKVGTTMGTAAYMSPEQIGGVDVDHRTDIWSFGIVLYEMLTAQQPFKGAYYQSVSYSIINEKEKPVKDLRAEASDEFDYLIKKCLEKNPDERFQDFSEILKFLKEHTLKTERRNRVLLKRSYSNALIIFLIVLIGSLVLWKILGDKNSASQGTEIKRVAILPFTNLKNDSQTNFLGFALADQIIGSLSYIKNILVRPSSSIRKYEHQNINLSEVGDDLKVDFVLTGNYLIESDKIRLNLEMVDLRSDEIIWRNDFDVEYQNTFTLQDVVTKKVVSGLEIKFTNDMKHSDTPKNPLAYEYYLRAVSYPLTNEADRNAIDILNKAVLLDSSYAPLYSELGYRYQLLSGYDLKSRTKLVEAEKFYLKALGINENLLGALANLSAYYTEIGETGKAVALIKRALKINPNYAQAHFWLGYIYRYTGLLEESAKEMETALTLDPLNPRFRSIGTTYAYLKKYDKAIKGFELDDDSPISVSWIGTIYFRMNQLGKAEEYWRRAVDLDSNGTAGVWAKAYLDYINKNKDEGIKLIKTLETSGTYDGEQFYNYANLYALYGNNEDCLRALKKAIDSGFYCYPLFQNDKFLDPVRSYPEFQKLLNLSKKMSADFKEKISKDSL